MPLHGKYEVKLGKSFLDPSQNSFMTMRCDFLPASVDREQPGSIKISNEKEVDVRLPNVSGAEASSTLFKGNMRPVQKECLLIYNKATGELTLERISKAAQLKNIRDGPPSKKLTEPANTTQSSSSSLPKTKVRTISQSSSDYDDRAPPPKAKRPTPSEQKSYSQHQQAPSFSSSNAPKRSTLSSSSSSSSSSESLNEVGLEHANAALNRKQPPRPPSSLSSLSDLDDSVTAPATSGGRNFSNPPSASLQRAMVANDLQLSESDSDEDDGDSS